MKLTEQLYLMIHSLNKAEKRSFKIYSQKYGKSKTKLILLFDLINAVEEYDEKYLNKQFKKKLKSGSLSYEKYKLKELLSNSLCDLHFNSVDSQSIGNVICKIELALKLKSPALMEEWLERGYKMCEQELENVFVPILKRFELKLMMLKKADLAEAVECSESAIRASKALIKDLQFQKMRNQFGSFMLKNFYSEDKAKVEIERLKLVNSKNFNADENELNFTQKTDLLYCRQINFSYLRDSENLNLVNRTIIEHLESEPNYIKRKFDTYTTFYGSMIVGLIKAKKIDLAEKYLERFSQLCLQNDVTDFNLVNAVKESHLFLSCVVSTYKYEYLAVCKKKAEIKKLLTKNAQLEETFDQPDVLLFLLIESEFALKKYEDCLDSISFYYSVFDKKSHLLVSHIENNFRLKAFEFACQFDLGNLNTANSLLKSIGYFLSIKEVQSDQLTLIKNLLISINKGKIEKTSLAEMKADYVKKMPEPLLVLLRWIEEKMEG